MLITSQDLLDLAEDLSSRSEEVGRRTAVNRAYYAAFLRCLQWERCLPAKGAEGVSRKGGVHQRLICRLKHPSPRCGASLCEQSRLNGEQLATQRALRVTADYKLSQPISDAQLIEQLSLAAQVLRRCGAVRPPQRPSNGRGRSRQR